VEKDGWLKSPWVNCPLPIKKGEMEGNDISTKKRGYGHASSKIYTDKREGHTIDG
jgi:hypothetical protein